MAWTSAAVAALRGSGLDPPVLISDGPNEALHHEITVPPAAIHGGGSVMAAFHCDDRRW